MIKYEFTFLLEKEDEAKNIQELVTALEGKIIQENNWGRKNLSYRIKKKSSAFFYNWIIELSANSLNEFKKKLNFNDQLLRYLILKID